MKRLPVGSLLIAGLALLLVLSTCSSRRALQARDAELDSLRTEQLAHRADSMGWATRLVAAQDEARSLTRVLQEREDSLDYLSVEMAALAREVELLGGRLATVSRMYLEAVGSIERHDAVAHMPLPGSRNGGGNPATPDSITGHVSDGLLEADVTATVDPPTVAIPHYSVALELVTAVTETADGRALFTARAGDPRVTVAHRETYWDPPAPVAYCSIGTRVRWGLGGVALGAAGGTLLGLWLGSLP